MRACRRTRIRASTEGNLPTSGYATQNIKRLLLKQKNDNTKMKNVFFLISIITCSFQLSAQDKTNGGSKPDTEQTSVQEDDEASKEHAVGEPKSNYNKEPIIKEVTAQLAAMQTKLLRELIAYCAKHEIIGEYVVDLTVAGKGKVITVFMVSGGDDIAKKNLLRTKLSELEFDNIKIPKKERVKFRYTLKF